MKIEKINNNQIRCTLTKADLIARQLKLSELAYGTEKAKSLFRDMMEQARDMMESATSEHEREAIRRFMSELERD